VIGDDDVDRVRARLFGLESYVDALSGRVDETVELLRELRTDHTKQTFLYVRWKNLDPLNLLCHY
jgi:hypothetical protein